MTFGNNGLDMGLDQKSKRIYKGKIYFPKIILILSIIWDNDIFPLSVKFLSGLPKLKENAFNETVWIWLL